MPPVEDHNVSGLDIEAKYLEKTVRQLVLMKETGPKSAAWHRARVQMIWRLHRKLAGGGDVGHISDSPRARARSSEQSNE